MPRDELQTDLPTQLALSFDEAAASERDDPCSPEPDASPTPHPATFADLLARIEADGGLPLAKRKNWLSRLRTLLRVTGTDIHAPVDRPRLLRLLDRLAAEHRGLGQQTRYNVRSAIRGMTERYHLAQPRPRPRDLSPSWRRIQTTCDVPLWRGISALAYWADRDGIRPEAVSQQDFEALRAFLRDETLESNTERKACRIVYCWNRIASQHPALGLAPLTWQSRRHRVSRDWEDLPGPFVASIMRYKEQALRPSVADTRGLAKPLAPRTVDDHVEGFRRAASVLLDQGFAADRLVGIATLCEAAAFRLWVEAEHARLGPEHCKALFNTVAALVAWARRTEAVDSGQIATMKAVLPKLGRRKPELTAKNRERLRAFADVEVQRRWLGLGDILVARAAKTDNPSKRDLLIQTALLHELLVAAPLRFGNIAALDLDRHFRWEGRGRSRRLRLILTAAEVKNRRDLEVELPSRVAALFERYLAEARPLLCADLTCRSLWPGRDGGAKHQVSLADQLKKTVRRDVGVTINPHLYRHLSAFFYLKRHPQDFETIRQLLGHKALSTTMAFYVEIDRMWASRQWGETLDTLRAERGDRGRRR